MALNLLLSKIIRHRANHASQTFHLITFQLLILAKNEYEIIVKEALICILDLRNQLSTNSCLHKGPHLC